MSRLDSKLTKKEQAKYKKDFEKQVEKSAKWTSQKELEDECTMLYIKYGLHVVPIKAKDWKYTFNDSLSNEEKKELETWRETKTEEDESVLGCFVLD